MKHTNQPKKPIRVVFAIILSLSMILGLAMTTAGAAGFDVHKDLESLSRHVAGITQITDGKKLDAANLTGDEAVNSQSLVRWARSLLGQDPDLTIKQGKTVTGGTYDDVIIDAAVGDDTVTLDGVTIKGQLIVQGGGSHSIKVQNCAVETVVLDKDTSKGGEAPRLELTGTTVESVEVAQPAIIEANSVAGETAIGEVTAKANVTVQGAATSIGTVTVPVEAKDNDVKLEVNGAKVETVSAAAPVTITADATAAKIDNVEARADVTVAGNTKIDTITVPEEAATPTIDVSSGSVNTVKAESEATVSGAENAIANVEAAAPVAVDSTAVAQVTVKVEVTVTVNGSGQIEVKVDTNADVEIKATSTQNLSVSTTQTVTNNITVMQGDEEQKVHIHKWVESGRVPAACTVPGTITYVCNELGCTVHTREETIPAKGHTEVLIPAVAPTCTVDGTTAGKECAVCGAVIVTPEVAPALDHHWLSSLASDETGHWQVCSRCDAIQEKHSHNYSTDDCTVAARCTECDYQKFAGTHTWNDGEVKTAATCETAGSILYTCISCKKTKTESIPALGHIYGKAEYEWNEETFACTAKRTCTRKGCEHEESETVQGTPVELKTPTCTEHGVTMYTAKFVNTLAFTAQTMQIKTDPTAHALKQVTAVAATCESAGNNEYWVCDTCGKAFTNSVGTTETNPAAQAIPALGHEYNTTTYTWDGDSCTAKRVCTRDPGHIDTETVKGVYTETKKPTYTQEGSYVYVANFTNPEFTEQTSTPTPIPAIPFIEVNGTKYGSFADALAAVYEIGKHPEQLFDLQYQVYPTIEIYGDCELNDLTLAAGESVTVKDGGSLTVNTLTLGESTMEGWMLDAGMITLEEGSSFKLGDIQYTGEGGAFAVNGAGSRIELTGKAKDMQGNNKVAMFFGDITMQGSFTMDSSYMFINDNGSVLTVKGALTNEVYLENRGAILIDGGTLINKNTIDNESGIAKAMEVTGQITVLSGGSLTNEGGNINGGIINKTASSAADITAMSNDESVSTILVSSSITVEEDLTVKHPLTVAKGGSLTVNSGVTLTFAPTNTSYWVISNLAVEQGGTITVNGTVKTVSTIDEHDFTRSINAQVAVIGGTFDAENGTVAEGSTIMFNSGTCKVPQSMTGVNVLRGLFGEEATEENLRAGLAESILQTVIVQDPIDLKQSEDLVIPTGMTLEIDSGAVDAYGCNIINNGTIHIGEKCALVVENGGTLTNNGTIEGDKDGEINIGDYIYGGLFGRNNVTSEYIEHGTNTVPVKKAAAVFTDNLQNALNNYDYVIPGGTETANNLNLDDGLTVPAGKILILKEQVIAGDNVYHNSFTLSGDMTLKGQMVTKGNPDVTVTGRIDAYDFLAFDSVTIDGYVYAEKEMMIVSTALTVSEGGTLEIGSGCTLNYMGQQPAVINGTLMNTVRYMNGIGENSIGAQSQIQGNIRQPNATLTTLLITRDTILHGDHTVDTVIPVQYEFENEEGEMVSVTPTLRVSAGSSLTFKTLYLDEGGSASQIIGLSGTAGNYTVLPAAGSVAEVSTATDFLAALDDPAVTDIRITGNITLTFADAIYEHPIRKPVTVASGTTLEVKPFDPSVDGEAEFDIMFNCMIIAENGSLTLEDHAALKTSCHFSGPNEPWHLYRGQVNVEGGALYAANGKLETYNDNFGNIYLEYGSGDLTLPVSYDNISVTFGVDSVRELYDANGDNRCNNLLLKCDATLTDDLTLNKDLSVDFGEYGPRSIRIVPNATLTVPDGFTFYADGPVTVYGKLVNHGKVQGGGMIDVMGGTLENDGAVELYADNGGLLALEKGGGLYNYTTDENSTGEPGIINAEMNFCDYWYDEEPIFAHWHVLDDDDTLNGMGRNIFILAAVFDPEQMQPALDYEDVWGENNEHHALRYNIVLASGTKTEDEGGSTVTLSGLTVNPYQTLLLKEYVDVGNTTYRNAVYNLSDIDFGENAGLRIKGAPTVNVSGSLNYSYADVDDGAIINGSGFVRNAAQLADALAAGGNIYLYPFTQSGKTRVELDGETSYETQYHIASFTDIEKDVNLIKMGGEDEPMGVFFDGGFTVDENATLSFNDLNVVAATPDSIINGTVEAYNGILVVQANSENGAVLTNNGTIRIGDGGRWGALAIFPKDYDGNKIVNRGTIWLCGGLMNIDLENEDQFIGNRPLNPDDYTKYADIVGELYEQFRTYDAMVSLANNDRALVDAYEDSRQMYSDNPNEPNHDSALDGFSWLIKNKVLPEYDGATHTSLRPYHLVTRDEVGELFTAFASRVLGTPTDLEISGSDPVCHRDNIKVVEPDGHEWFTSEKNRCFDALRTALRPLGTVEVYNEEDFLDALDTPYVVEIHVATYTTLNGCYYKDGQRVDKDDPHDDQGVIFLWGAGERRDQERHIIVDPYATLTVKEGARMEIQQSVELLLADGENNSNGILILEENSGLNVFGSLKPDNWPDETGEGDNRHRKYVIEEENSYINFFPDVMGFAEELCRRFGDRVDLATATDIASYTDLAEEWPNGDGRESFFAFAVKYGLPYHVEKDWDGKDYNVWRPWDKIRYGEAMTVLGNIYKAIWDASPELPESAELPEWVSLEEKQDDWCISDHDINELLNKFVNVLPPQDDATESFTIIRDNVHDGEENLSNEGMTITCKNFTKHVTILCDPQYLNDGDDWGGEINFQNCTFSQGVTVKAVDGIDFRVNFTNSCSVAANQAVTVTAPASYTYEEGPDFRNYNHRVELCGAGGMRINANTFVCIREVKNQNFTAAFNGTTFTVDAANTNNSFQTFLRWDYWWDEAAGEFQSTPLIQVETEEPRDEGIGAVRLATVGDDTCTCKVRVCGVVDVSGLKMPAYSEGISAESARLELANATQRSAIELGSNDILICDDCSGEYRFIGTGTVYVPNQNGYANITINDVNLGQPHIFGDGDCGIFFPVSYEKYPNAITFTVEQGHWNDQAQCVTDWSELTYAVQDGGDCIQLVKDENNAWIDDPHQVRVTVEIPNSCTVVYDPIMWKPIQINEFMDLLAKELHPNCDFSSLGLNGGDFLTYGKARTILSYVWGQYPDAGPFDPHTIITENRYWDDLQRWNDTPYDQDPHKDNWNPDNWTRDWDSARYMVDELKKALGIREIIEGDVTLTLRRNPSGDPEETVSCCIDGQGEETLDGNFVENFCFNGNVTIVCDTSQLGNDDWGGEIRFRNCSFANPVTVQLTAGVNYNVHLCDSCTGAFVVAAEDSVKSVDRTGVSFIGTTGVTVNGLTVTGINGWSGDDYRVNARFDRQGEEPDVSYVPTMEILNNRNDDSIITVSGEYSGKLRYGASVDYNGVTLSEGSWFEPVTD